MSEADCPRCGYDQSGIIPTWTDACPCRGRCTECGLEFLWGELFGGGLHGDRLLSEHARWRWLPVALMLTPVVAHVPAILWRRLRMEHPIRLARLTLQSLVVLVVAYAFAASAAIAFRTTSADAWWRTMRDGRAVVAMTVAPMQGIVSLQHWQSVGWTGAGPVMGWVSLTTPSAELWRFGRHFAQPRFALAAVTTSVLSVAAFAALPISRRQAKVRFAHLLRVWCYLAMTLPCLWGLCIVVKRSGVLRPWVLGSTMPVAYVEWWPALVILALWLFVVWRSAARSYLRMSRPSAVAASVSAISSLATFLGCAIFLL